MPIPYIDLNRFGFDPGVPQFLPPDAGMPFPPAPLDEFRGGQRGYQPVYDQFPVDMQAETRNLNDPTGQIPWYEQQAGLSPSIMQRLPQITPGGAPSVVPLPQAEQPRNQPGPGDNLIGPGNPPIRPIGPSSDYGGFQVADLNAGRDPWVNLNGNTFMPNWQQSNPEMADSFNSRFFFDQPQYNYPQPQQQLPQIPWYESNPGSTVIDNPPRFNDQSWRPAELGTFQGQPYVPPLDPGPQNTFNSRFNEVYNQPSFFQEVPSYTGGANQYVDQGFRDLGMGGPSYDQYTFNPGGDFPSFESPVAEGGMRMVGGDTLPTTIAQPPPPLPGHNATGYYDPHTNATSFPQHTGPGGTPVAAGPSYVAPQGNFSQPWFMSTPASTFSPIAPLSSLNGAMLF